MLSPENLAMEMISKLSNLAARVKRGRPQFAVMPYAVYIQVLLSLFVRVLLLRLHWFCKS